MCVEVNKLAVIVYNLDARDPFFSLSSRRTVIVVVSFGFALFTLHDSELSTMSVVVRRSIGVPTHT